MKGFRWVHLSDIHFENINYDTKRLRQKLLNILGSKSKGYYSYLIITGDLLYRYAQNGNFAEVEKYIEQIISHMKISKDNVFIVPGNHDVSRDKRRELLIKGVKIEEERISESVEELDEQSYRDLMEGHQNFKEFYERLLGRPYDTEKLHFIDETNDMNVLHLNTCLISGMNNEEGSLSVYLSKLLECVSKDKDESKLNIVIGHHSIECLNRRERKEILLLLEDYNIDLILTGHTHKGKFQEFKEGNKTIINLTCGAITKDNFADVNFIEGKMEENKVSVIYYKWSEKLSNWCKDVEIDRKAIEGEIQFYVQKETCEIACAEDTDLNESNGVQEKVSINSFERFLIELSDKVERYTDDETIDIKDVDDKFKNMKCSKNMEKEFEGYSEYFSLIEKIISSPSYISYDRKMVIPGVIKDTYYEVLDDYSTGTQILVRMIDILYHEYKNILNIPKEQLKQCFKIVIYWSINKCDIYDDFK